MAPFRCCHSYSRSLAVRGEVGARLSKRVRRAREKMTPSGRPQSVSCDLPPSFQWVGLMAVRAIGLENRQGVRALRVVDDERSDRCGATNMPDGPGGRLC
jgi:hypothetical protein